MIALPEAFVHAPLAHRALHDVDDGRPENSRAAIAAAVSAGYGIEIDVQLSRDHVAMVFHDDVLDRLTGETGPVRALDASRLGDVGLRGGSEGIPALPEILHLVNGQVPLLIEIKDQDGQMGGNIGPLEQAVAQAVKGYKGPLALMSFNPYAVACIADLCPDIPRGLVTSSYDPQAWGLPPQICDHLREIPDYDRVGASFISHEVDDLASARVAQLKADGARILCWTVRSSAQEEQARRVAENVTFEGYLAQLSA